MFNNFWERWAEVVIRFPKTVISICLVVMAIFAAITTAAPKDLSFTGMLDKDEPELIRYREAVRIFGASTAMVLLLEGPSDRLDAVTRRLVDELPDITPLSMIVPPADAQWVIDRAPWLWPDALFDSALRELEPGGKGEPGAITRMAIEEADQIIRTRVRPVEEARIIGMSFEHDIFDMAMGGVDYKIVEREVNRILADEGGDVTGDFTGFAAVGAQDQNHVFGRIKILTPLTLITVLILLMAVERQPGRIALTGVALAGSVAIAYGSVALILGKLGITSTFFGMLLLGLGIDFAIHLLLAMRDAHSAGQTPEDSVRTGMTLAAPAIVLGGMTTAVASSVTMFVPQPGALEMGLTAATGIVASLVMMLSFLPAGWLLIERRRPHSESMTRLELPGLHRLVGLSIRHPWTVIGLTAVVCVLGGSGLTRYHMEDNLEEIMTRDVPALEVDRRISKLYGYAPISYTIPVDTLDEARRLAELFKKKEEIGAVYSAADWIQGDPEDRRQRLAELLNQDIERTPRGEALAARLGRALELGPIDLNEIPLALRSGIIGEGGALAVQIVPKVTTLDASVIHEHIESYRAIAPQTTGMAVVAELLMSGRRDWIPVLMGSILFILLAILSVSFRNVRDVALSIIPVVIGALVAMGLFFWMGFSFSILTGVVIPVILGLGVDDGIHVIARLRRGGDRSDEGIHRAVEGVGRAIFLTSATTTISFVGLFFSDHRGLESMAQFMTIGMPLCFIASVTVLPAVAKVWRGNETK